MPGIKHAARRKLQHELGIDPKEIPHSDFRFLTRFHYWAADTITHGNASPWGEHEIDYILLLRAKPTVDMNLDEVDQVRYVTQTELRSMLSDSELRWSPWFVGIMERGGWEWWDHLDEAFIEGGRFCDGKITYFDPPSCHEGEFNLASNK